MPKTPFERAVEDIVDDVGRNIMGTSNHIHANVDVGRRVGTIREKYGAEIPAEEMADFIKKVCAEAVRRITGK